MDDNIIADKKYAKQLFRKLIPLNIRWYAQASINIAKDDELLALAYKSGCRMLTIGLETISQNQLEIHNKPNSAKDYPRFIS